MLSPMTPRQHPLSCVVCGYDLEGVTSSWSDRCPLRGRCSECGSEIDWSEIHRPEIYEERRFYEHEQSRFPRDLVRTAWRALWPTRFWAWAPRSQPVRPGRLLSVVATGLVAWGGLGIVGGVVALYAGLFVTRLAGIGWGNVMTPRAFLLRGPLPVIIDARWLTAAMFHSLAGVIVVLWVLLARSRQIRVAHVLRGWVYTCVSLCVPFVVIIAFHACRRVLWYGMWLYPSWIDDVFEWLGYILPAAWMWHAWVCFLSRYVKTARPRATVAAYGSITVLVFLLGCSVYSIVTDPYP